MVFLTQSADGDQSAGTPAREDVPNMKWSAKDAQGGCGGELIGFGSSRERDVI